ncbi:pyruvate, phosphate dikinase [Hornefia butyriciproducens]|uniref:pyruvate, phosphate dikinase n=1 Tax=Hornefia butyriciproducens TaxID=2652293 RepID=UPI002A916FA2|nr:pyruvate, phosphate dikinase [Hornefia butyriciproducens]MCI7412142.1 pyruvate, phosphate dikinase [Clostridiales bacterium]MDY6212640.1 pyruvate, phosphate dikinase [Hornefia butyriciproducens]
MEKKFVYSFNEGSKDMRALLGGKGANLAEMTKSGMPVPFGFTVTTDACKQYYADGGKIDDSIIEEIKAHQDELESVMGKKLGDPEDPLLVSVRSGAPISMPGMMDTVLNLGLNDETVVALAKQTDNERFAYDSYRRFLQMFGDVVMEVPMKQFNEIFDGKKAEVGAEFDVDLKTEDLKDIIEGYKKLYVKVLGREFPQDPQEQLMEAIKAVFRSWGNDRAILYRKLNDIPEDLGTAVNVQSMVFGNKGNDSGTGVAFTRNPATGENVLYGEFLVNAQGEDVVAGIRTPKKISEMAETFPEVYAQFKEIASKLEQHYTDMQDMEFTVENGKLFMLQTRNGKRTAEAAVNIAVDMVNEGLIDKKTAVLRIEPDFVEHLLHPRFDADEEAAATPIAHGLNASPGAACGKICFSADEAAAAAEAGEKAILVRTETSPEDLAGMVAAQGILTAHGGATSHAAVVARGMGKCCVTGCSVLKISEEEKTLEVGGKVYGPDDYISVDGTTGDVYSGLLKLVPPDISGNFDTIMSWADELRTMKVRTNADTPRDAKQAIEFGAEGIGLCRTEHMFFEEERIPAIREMIIADTEEARRKALAKLLPFQKSDFKAMYKTMGDRPMTVRLLDPPLHEFLPKTPEEVKQLSESSGVSVEKIEAEAAKLKEFNPMLGHRGCRLAVSYPEIAEMQTEAIITAALEVIDEEGIEIVPEIMIPLVGSKNELANVKKTVVDTINRCFEKAGKKIDYLVGTMIEIPRAALTADEIAEEAEFFSFGTNDLTQMTFGFSRDDTAELIRSYVDKGILESDPFKTIDQNGVGKLVENAVKLGKKTRPNIHLGICGEHGGDPKSIEFCNKVGLQYVSCSPYRVPVARLAAAQAAIKQEQK